MSIQRNRSTTWTREAEPPLYERSDGGNPYQHVQYFTEEFIGQILEEEHPDVIEADPRIADVEFEGSTYSYTNILFVYPDGTRVFVGRDETSKEAGIFGYAITPDDPVPGIETIDGALALLQPNRVAERVSDPDVDAPPRQGEWWFLEDVGQPESDVFKGDVGSRPYGPSPLDNHIPRDYALGVTANEFLTRVQGRLPSLEVETVPQVFEEVFGRGYLPTDIGDATVTERDLRELCDGIYVRGTVRHRYDEHYMLRLSDAWHRAETHTIDVYTPDAEEILGQRFSVTSSSSGPRVD